MNHILYITQYNKLYICYHIFIAHIIIYCQSGHHSNSSNSSGSGNNSSNSSGSGSGNSNSNSNDSNSYLINSIIVFDDCLQKHCRL